MKYIKVVVGIDTKKFFAYFILFIFLLTLIPSFSVEIGKAEKILVERGQDWNKYSLGGGSYQFEGFASPINYYNGNDWNPIDLTIETLDVDHLAYQYGYRYGNSENSFSTYFKPDASSNFPLAFSWSRESDPTNINVLRAELSGVGYLDPTSGWDYVVLQETLNSNVQVGTYNLTYPSVFTGTDLIWSLQGGQLKEDIIATNDTRTVLENNPPSDYGFSNQDSYLVFITKLDMHNIEIFEGETLKTGNFTITEGKLDFKNVSGDILFSLPIGYVYEQHGSTVKDLVYRVIQHQGEYYLLSGLKVIELNDMTFPVIFDPSFDVVPSYHKSYYASGGSHNGNATNTESNGRFFGSEYNYRTAYWLNTSAIPNSVVVESACFRFVFSDNGFANDELEFYTSDPDVGYPLMTDWWTPDQTNLTNWNRDYYDINDPAGSRNTNGLSLNVPYNWTLTNFSHINLTGYTNYLIGYHDDVIGDTTVDEVWSYYPSYPDDWYKPRLYVNFSTTTTYVDTLPATGVENTNATMRGNLWGIEGAETTYCGFRYGNLTGVYDCNQTGVVTAQYADFSSNVGGLTPGNMTFFQAWGNSANGWDAGDELKFLTKPTNASDLEIVRIADGMNISWDHGAGYTYSVLRFSTTNFPTSPTDGTGLYNGTKNYFEHTVLSNGTTYYYRVWEYTRNATHSLYQFSSENDSIAILYTKDLSLDDPTFVEENSARFTATIVIIGNGPFEVGFWYGNETVNASSHQYNVSVGSYDVTTDFLYDAVNLVCGEYYYVRAWAQNSTAQNVTALKYFITKPNATTDLQVNGSGYTNISLNWTKPVLGDSVTQNTLVKYSDSAYPTDPETGDFVGYNGTASEAEITGLSPDTTYFFSVWSYVSASGSPTYYEFSDGYATVASSTAGGTYNIYIRYENGSNGLVDCNASSVHWAENSGPHEFIVHYEDKEEVNRWSDPGTGTFDWNISQTPGISTINNGKIVFTSTSTVLFMEFHWNSTRFGYYNQSYRCSRIIVPDPGQRNITFYIRTDLPVYGESAYDFNKSLVQYSYSFQDKTRIFDTKYGLDTYAYIYKYNSTGSRIIIHKEFWDGSKKVYPMLVYDGFYLMGVGCSELIVDSLCIAPTGTDLGPNIIIDIPINITYFVTDFISYTQGWSPGATGFWVHYADSESGTISTNFSVYDYFNRTLVFSDESTLDNKNYSYPDANQSLPYVWVITINHTEWTENVSIGSFIMPIHETPFNDTNLSNWLDLLLGETPFRNIETGEEVSWVYVLVGVVAFFILVSFGSYHANGGVFITGGFIAFCGSILTVYQVTLLNASLIPVGIFMMAIAVIAEMGGFK